MSKISIATDNATQIKNETIRRANTANRVGSAMLSTIEAIIEEVGLKVTAVAGYGLSENNYSDADMAEVAKVANKQDQYNGELAITFFQDQAPSGAIDGDVWYKPTLDTIVARGGGVWSSFLASNKIFSYDGNRYIYSGLDIGNNLLTISELPTLETPYYTENSAENGSFTLHRNEILSFTSTIEFTLNIALEAPIDGRPNIYHLCANMGAVARTVSLSCTGHTITWAGGSAPIPEISKPFEISFIKVAPTIIQAIFKQL